MIPRHSFSSLTWSQLIPGHEAIGKVVAMGDKVTGFEIGDRVAADVGGESTLRSRGDMADRAETCGYCHYCRRGQELFCEHFSPAGVTRDGTLRCLRSGVVADWE